MLCYDHVSRVIVAERLKCVCCLMTRVVQVVELRIPRYHHHTSNGSVLFRLLRDSETVSYSLFP